MINKRDQYAIRTTAINEGITVGMEKVFSLLENGMSLADAKKKLGMQT